MGPGIGVELPILNWNKGGTTRARAEIERATKQYITVQQTVRADVLKSYNNFKTAMSVYQILKDEIVPIATRAVTNSEKAYLIGEISYLEFLEFKRQLLEAQIRFAESEAEVRRSNANLFYSVGSKITQ